jgi:transcriptional regulator with XRE-family HTH domain
MHPIDPIIAELKWSRRRQRISQRALAAALGTQQSAVSEWETGRVQPSLTSVRSYAEAVGCQIVVVPAEEP